MEDHPLISICIPTYKTDRRYLLGCLNSVINSAGDKKDIEILLCEQGDDVSYVLESFPKVRIIHQSVPSPYSSRITLWNKSTGDYVLFVDADDELPPNSIPILRNAIREHRDGDIFQFRFIRDCEATADTFGEEVFWEKVDHTVFLNDILSSGRLNSVCTKLISKRLKPKFFDVDISMGEDKLLSLSFAKDAKAVYQSEVILYLYRSNPNSTTAKVTSVLFDGWGEMSRVIEENFVDYPSRIAGHIDLIRNALGCVASSIAKGNLGKSEFSAIWNTSFIHLFAISKKYKKERRKTLGFARNFAWNCFMKKRYFMLKALAKLRF